MTGRTSGILMGLVGLALLAWLVHEAGVDELGRRLAELGPLAPLALAPYALASLCDARGWRAVLRAFDIEVPFVRLWLVRLAGEAVNSVVPTGVGGEPLKVLLLRADGVSASALSAAVVVSRTIVMIAQALLVVLGVGALLARLGWTLEAPIAVAGLIVLAGVFGLVLVRVQQRGLGRVLARALAWVLPSGRLGGRVNRMATALDARLAWVYESARVPLLVAMAWHMLAWLVTAAEVWVVLRLLRAPVSWGDALIVEGLAQPIRATCIIVPGALGTQEGGGVAVCRWLGVAPAAGLALWLVVRARETLFDAIGLLYLAVKSPRAAARAKPCATAGSQISTSTTTPK